jgi:RimJ/RimL family protein N-acetyltransferase
MQKITAPNLKTKRLLLRQWKNSDLPIFAKINSNSEVMQFFPSLLTQTESDVFAKKIIQELQEKPYGLWAVEIPAIAPFIGFIGLHYQDFKATFTPCIEIGWRLDSAYWKKGYATEAGKKVLEYAFKTLKLNEVVSFTSEKNFRSIALMKRLGLHYHPENNFEHPKLPKGHPLSYHVFYSMSKQEWLQANQ